MVGIIYYVLTLRFFYSIIQIYYIYELIHRLKRYRSQLLSNSLIKEIQFPILRIQRTIRVDDNRDRTRTSFQSFFTKKFIV